MTIRTSFPRLPALTLALALAVPAPAFAHAVVVNSTPRAGGTVPAGNRQFTVIFNSRIDKQRSKLTLIGPDGHETPVPLETAGPEELLTGKAGIALPGKYRLRWQVLAIDGHITRGDIPFTLGDATPEAGTTEGAVR